MSNAPVVSWYEGSQDETAKVVSTINFGTVDADSASAIKQFNIWNNREGLVDLPKMEEVVFTTRDRQGGLGDTVGNIVEAVRDNWFNGRCDSMGATAWTPVGKGDPILNPTGTLPLGTTGTTKNVNASTALTWVASTPLSVGVYVQPTTPNGFIYKVVKAGVTNSSQPAWVTSESATFVDGTVEYQTILINKTPKTQEILGLAHKTNSAGSNASDAGGNFATLSVYAEVPITASAGRNLLLQRVSYRYV